MSEEKSVSVDNPINDDEDPPQRDGDALVDGPSKLSIDEAEGVVSIEKKRGPSFTERALSLQPDSAAYMYIQNARGSTTPVTVASVLSVTAGASGAMSCKDWTLPASLVPIVLLVGAYYFFTAKSVLFAQKNYFYGNDCTYKEEPDEASYWHGQLTEKIVSAYLRPVYRLFYSDASPPLGKPADVSYEKVIKAYGCLPQGQHTLDVWSGHVVFRESSGIGPKKTAGTHVVPTQNLQWLMFSTTGKKFGRLVKVMTLLIFLSVIIGIPVTMVSCGGLVTKMFTTEPPGSYNNLFGKYDVTYSSYPVTTAALAKVQYADSSDEETKWTNFKAAADIAPKDEKISEEEFKKYKAKDQSLLDEWGLRSCRKKKDSSSSESNSDTSTNTWDGSDPSQWRLAYKSGGCGATECGCGDRRRLTGANFSSAALKQNSAGLWYSTDMWSNEVETRYNQLQATYNQLQASFPAIRRILPSCESSSATCQQVCNNVKADSCYSKDRIDCDYNILWQGALGALVLYLLSIALPIVLLLLELGLVGYSVYYSIEPENYCYLPAAIIMALLVFGWIIYWTTDKKKYLTIPIKEGPGAWPGDTGPFKHLSGSIVCAMPDQHELGVEPDDVAGQLLPRMLGRDIDKSFMDKIGCKGGVGMADTVSLFEDHIEFHYTIGGKCCGGKDMYYILLQDIQTVVALKPPDLGLKM
eukprot:SAG31_NODE_656_length_13120_cov_10.091237_1_plen_694_part_00